MSPTRAGGLHQQAAETEHPPMSSSPTFVAKFADGVVTRMTCHCEPDQLDVQRGIKLSRFAYETRTKKPPPLIVEGRFVEPFTDTVIKAYAAAELRSPIA
jgi:hypothetical protein